MLDIENKLLRRVLFRNEIINVHNLNLKSLLKPKFSTSVYIQCIIWTRRENESIDILDVPKS